MWFSTWTGRRTGGARMTAVVTIKSGQTGRHYRLPDGRGLLGSSKGKGADCSPDILHEWERGGKLGLCPVPDEPISNERHTSCCWKSDSFIRHYDLRRFIHSAAESSIGGVGSTQYVMELKPELISDYYLPLLLSIVTVDGSNMSCTRWNSFVAEEDATYVLARQALPMVWDFRQKSN